MESKEFVISEIKKIVEVIKYINIRCDYMEELNCYVIEVNPTDVYHFDIRYLGWSDSFIDEFTKRFPLEYVCFTTGNTCCESHNPIYESLPADYYATIVAKKVPYYKYI